MTRNPWAESGRAVKVALLIAQIRRELKGLDADSGAQLVADFLREQDPKWWLALAQRAGVRTAIERRKVPGPETREAVAKAFESIAQNPPSDEPTDTELSEIASW